jgi:hypothetical protein
VRTATGAAGTPYLCHRFLIHERPDGAYPPVEQAIRLALTEVT